MLKLSNCVAVILELDCGATTLITDTSGNISLPRNPTGYLASVNCTYTISTNRTDVIWLRPNYDWMKFLQSFQDCHKEYLMVSYLNFTAILSDELGSGRKRGMGRPRKMVGNHPRRPARIGTDVGRCF